MRDGLCGIACQWRYVLTNVNTGGEAVQDNISVYVNQFVVQLA